MVMLQVEHVNRLFAEITALRAANWVEVNSNLDYIFTQCCWYFEILIVFKYVEDEMQLYTSRITVQFSVRREKKFEMAGLKFSPTKFQPYKPSYCFT
jgi:uncharacterized membrane protein YpjA